MLKPVEHTNCTSLSYLSGDSLTSFIDTLLQSVLEPVLQANEPATPAPVQAPSIEPAEHTQPWLSENELSSFLASLQPQIEQMARSLYYTVKISVAFEDLVQEGIIAAWQATRRYDASKVVNERSVIGYCMKRVRGAMLDHVTKLNRTPAISLDEYLEADTDGGSCYREIEARPVEHRQASLSERRRILAALHKLTEKERSVILAYFRIDDSKGQCPSRDDVQARLNLSDHAYCNARARAIKRLATLLQPA